jgi:hypothetical protein
MTALFKSDAKTAPDSANVVDESFDSTDSQENPRFNKVIWFVDRL